MSEIRHDPLRGGTVIVAHERSQRPLPAWPYPELPPIDPSDCPFCPGNEDACPPSFRRIADPSLRQPWRIRVVPNRYPALAVEASSGGSGGRFTSQHDGLGAHEVLIETPDHAGVPLGEDDDDAHLVLSTWFERVADLHGDRRLCAFVPFKNHGLLAGATLSHPHSQLLAMPFLPTALAACLDRARTHFAERHQCLICELVAEERSLGVRVVHQDEDVVVLCPFASRAPWELLIVPLQHAASVTALPTRVVLALARSIRIAVRTLEAVLGRPAWNLLVTTAPNPRHDGARPGQWKTLDRDFHNHFSLVPRLVPLAGYELATGSWINSTRPEDAAATLRRNWRAE